MYNLMFVDDDVLIAESVRDILDWGCLSLNAPFIAYSFEQALGVFAHEHIDILISDIEMFGHSGLDLVEWTKQNHPKTMCCFLTCHARFDYAQQAIQLGTHGYLLKPLDEVALEKLLTSCVTHLDKSLKHVYTDDEAERPYIVQQAVRYIHQNLSDAINREILSQELHISESNLSRIFNREIGMSISEYISECRMKRAMELLATTNLTVTKICNQIGYNYPAYFTKAFREKTGQTPHQFRDASRNNM